MHSGASGREASSEVEYCRYWLDVVANCCESRTISRNQHLSHAWKVGDERLELLPEESDAPLGYSDLPLTNLPTSRGEYSVVLS